MTDLLYEVAETSGISDDSTRQFWEMVDQQFKDITTASKSAFVLNKNINVIIVIIGIIIIGSSLSYTWVKGVDQWSTLSTGIGIASFVVVFFNNPQSNINKAVASLASVYIIYKGHKVEFEAIASALAALYSKQNPDWSVISNSNTTKMEKLNKELQDSTARYVELINSHLKVFSGGRGVSENQGVSENKNKQ